MPRIPSSLPRPFELANKVACQSPLVKINEDLLYFNLNSHCFQKATDYELEQGILNFLAITEKKDDLKFLTKRYIKDTLYFLLHKNHPICEPAEYSGWLGFKNGAVNIFNHEFIESTPENMHNYPTVTYALNVCYYPYGNIFANTPVTDAFFSHIAEGNLELQNRLWEMLGYILTPDINAKAFFLLQGVPNSGKSVLGRFIEQFFPRGKISALNMNRLGSQFLPDQLVYSCLNASMDLPNGLLSPNAIAIIKMMTGNDRITQEAKYKNPNFVYSHCKLLFSTNHPLSLKKYDPAFLDRIICIPFKTSVAKADADRNLFARLCAESEAVVNKALYYYWNLQAKNYEFSGGLILPDLEYHLTPNEVIEAFVNECCIYERNGKTHTSELYKAYQQFCSDKGFRSVPDQGFSQRLSNVCGSKIEHAKWRDRGNPENGWLGITLVKYKTYYAGTI